MKNKIHLNGDMIELGVDTVIRITNKKISKHILSKASEGYYVMNGDSRIKVEERYLYDFYLDTTDNRKLLRMIIKNRT